MKRKATVEITQVTTSNMEISSEDAHGQNLDQTVQAKNRVLNAERLKKIKERQEKALAELKESMGETNPKKVFRIDS
jgi:hypothetical protein